MEGREEGGPPAEEREHLGTPEAPVSGSQEPEGEQGLDAEQTEDEEPGEPSGEQGQDA